MNFMATYFFVAICSAVYTSPNFPFPMTTFKLKASMVKGPETWSWEVSSQPHFFDFLQKTRNKTCVSFSCQVLIILRAKATHSEVCSIVYFDAPPPID